MKKPKHSTPGAIDNRYASVWDAIEDTPAEAQSMKLRSALMMAASDIIRRSGWTQVEAAAKMGVTQPRISDLLRGKISFFNSEALFPMLNMAGATVEIKVRRARRALHSGAVAAKRTRSTSSGVSPKQERSAHQSKRRQTCRTRRSPRS